MIIETILAGLIILIVFIIILAIRAGDKMLRNLFDD